MITNLEKFRKRRVKTNVKINQDDSDTDSETEKDPKKRKRKKKTKIVNSLKLLLSNLLNWKSRIDNLLESSRNDEKLLEFGKSKEELGESLFDDDLSFIKEENEEIEKKKAIQNVEEVKPEVETPKKKRGRKKKIKPEEENVNIEIVKEDGVKQDPFQQNMNQDPVEEIDCGICLLDLHDGRPIYSLFECGHIFHLYCVSRCLNSRNIQKKCLKCHIPIERDEEKQVQQLMTHENRKMRLAKRKK